MKMNELLDRWLQDELLVKVRREYITNTPSDNMTQRDWYETFVPKEMHPYAESYCADLRGIDYRNESLAKEHTFGEARLDYANFSGSDMDETDFQRAFLTHADFSSCKIRRGSFHPVFGYKANFSNCSLDECSFQGFGPMRYGPDMFRCSDLTSSTFEGSTVNKSAFQNVDFRHANFCGTTFTDCNFTGSDLRGIVVDKNTRFIRCDFRCACLDDISPFTDFFKSGTLGIVEACLHLNAVNWVKDATFPGDVPA
jgi:uncharacterized protein YjbI with pentapeptide repeats